MCSTICVLNRSKSIAAVMHWITVRDRMALTQLHYGRSRNRFPIFLASEDHAAFHDSLAGPRTADAKPSPVGKVDVAVMLTHQT